MAPLLVNQLKPSNWAAAFNLAKQGGAMVYRGFGPMGRLLEATY